jgi:hypothetical protein
MVATTFDQHADKYSPAHAYWLGRAARLAYGDEAEIRRETESWGFDQLTYFCGTHQMPFPIEDTQAYLAGQRPHGPYCVSERSPQKYETGCRTQIRQ